MHPERPGLFLALVLFCSVPAFAQDWKAQYDEAIRHYQGGQYPAALASAKAAYVASEKLDPRNQVYTLQLITVICLDGGNADEGLKWIEKEVTLFAQIEGVKSKTHAEALGKHARFLVQKGQVASAEARCKEALAVYASAGLEQSIECIDLNFLYGQLLALNNKAAEALPIVEQSTSKYAGNPERGEEYIDALLLSASLSERQNDRPTAEKKYRQLVGLLEKNNLKELPAYAQAKTGLSRMATSAEATQILKSGVVDPSERAKQLLKIAVDHQNAHQYAQAVENFDIAEKAITEGKLQNNTAFAIYLNYGRLLTEQKRLNEAATRLELAGKVANALYRAPAPELALLEFANGDLSIARSQVPEAGRHYTAALTNSAQLPLNLRLQYLTHSARNMLTRDQPAIAAALVGNDVALLPEKSVSEVLFMEAVITYSEALTANNHSDIAIKSLKELAAKPVSGTVKIHLQQQEALVLRESGQWATALAVLNEVSKEQAIDAATRIRLEYQLGDLYLQLGNFSDAEKHLLAAVSEIKKSAPNDNLQLDVYNSLAMLYTRLGNYERAEAMYMDLLKMPDPVPGFHTSVQQNLAALYFESARYTEAQLLLEDVLIQDRERYGEEHPDYAASMQNLAAVYLKNHQLDKARQMYEKALALDARHSGTQSLSYATKAANLGIVYDETGDLNKALQFLELALKIRETRLGKEHPDYVFNEYNLANVYEEMGQSQKALPLFRHVGTFYIQQIHELFPAMSEREKTAFYNKISEVITAYLDFMIKQASTDKAITGELYDFRLSTKALLLNASSKIRDRILSSKDPQLMEAFSSWLITKEELGKLYTLSSEERQANKELIASLQQEANELERQLSQRSELFAENSSQAAVDWKKVRQALSPGEAAIEIIRLGLDAKKDSVLYAALILRNEYANPQLIVFPNSKNMETKEFSFYRNSIQYQQDNNRSYVTYWKPLERSLQGVSNVYVSADGVFNKVSLATLWNPASNKYLIEDYSVGLVSSTRELVAVSQANTPLHSAALFGNPEFGSSSPQSTGSKTRGMNNLARGIIGQGISPLPGTLGEVNNIDAFLKENKWETQTFLGSTATEQAIKQQSNPGILHIATHGFFVETADEEDAVVGGGDINQSEHNPLLRAGLVLAGAGKYLFDKGPAGEDGVLTAYEAMNLTLDKTDLVVLSACETGAGEVRNGEGVYGLQRSFILAGASNLLMSLWKVDDQATLYLMLQFYKDLQNAKNKTKAFRATQLEIMKTHPHPYYWGSFVLIGHN